MKINTYLVKFISSVNFLIIVICLVDCAAIKDEPG
jgi:hypothetical protein